MLFSDVVKISYLHMIRINCKSRFLFIRLNSIAESVSALCFTSSIPSPYNSPRLTSSGTAVLPHYLFWLPCTSVSVYTRSGLSSLSTKQQRYARTTTGISRQFTHHQVSLPKRGVIEQYLSVVYRAPAAGCRRCRIETVRMHALRQQRAVPCELCSCRVLSCSFTCCMWTGSTHP